MKTLLAAVLLIAATQLQAQTQLENDLDGNAGALEASEMRPTRSGGRL